MKIYPSLLSCDFGRLREEALALQAAGADGLHVDVMDYAFVPNLTIGPDILKSALKGHVNIPLDCHLMVEKPRRMLDAFADAGATGITVHFESDTHLQGTLTAIRSLGLKAGVSLNPHTDYKGLEWVLDDCDLILCMTVNPGFGGQKLIPQGLRKAAELKKFLLARNLSNIAVQIDGGVTLQHSSQLKSAGLDIVVAGSAIFNSGDYKTAIRTLRGQP